MIGSKDVSVILQGAIDYRCTDEVIRSVRRFLPDSELIVSTWKNDRFWGMVECDKLVLSDDVGGTRDKVSGFVNNTSRQLRSTLAGIQQATRPYVLKLRTDLVLTGTNFLNVIDSYPIREDSLSLFSKRVVVCSYFFKKYLGIKKERIQPVPFHMSDWAIFGIREDILALFKIPLPVEPMNTDYFLQSPFTSVKPRLYVSQHRFTPEQYIFVNAFAPKFPEIFKNVTDLLSYDSKLLEDFEKLVVNNFVILDVDEFSLYCSKNDGVDPYYEWSSNPKNLPYVIFEGLYTHLEFERDYKKYLDPEYILDSKLIEKERLLIKKHYKEEQW